jgi:hypothetical protein
MKSSAPLVHSSTRLECSCTGELSRSARSQRASCTRILHHCLAAAAAAHRAPGMHGLVCMESAPLAWSLQPHSLPTEQHHVVARRAVASMLLRPTQWCPAWVCSTVLGGVHMHFAWPAHRSCAAWVGKTRLAQRCYFHTDSHHAAVASALSAPGAETCAPQRAASI